MITAISLPYRRRICSSTSRPLSPGIITSTSTRLNRSRGGRLRSVGAGMNCAAEVIARRNCARARAARWGLAPPRGLEEVEAAVAIGGVGDVVLALAAELGDHARRERVVLDQQDRQPLERHLLQRDAALHLGGVAAILVVLGLGAVGRRRRRRQREHQVLPPRPAVDAEAERRAVQPRRHHRLDVDGALDGAAGRRLHRLLPAGAVGVEHLADALPAQLVERHPQQRLRQPVRRHHARHRRRRRRDDERRAHRVGELLQIDRRHGEAAGPYYSYWSSAQSVACGISSTALLIGMDLASQIPVAAWFTFTPANPGDRGARRWPRHA